jgi:hypothetical protein
MTTRRESRPVVAVFCSCGSQWFGRYVESPAVRAHAASCGPPVSRAEFEGVFGHAVNFPAHWTERERESIR